MTNLPQLEEIAIEQLKNFKKKDSGVTRDIKFDKYLNTKQITVISGIRRCGKSTLLSQFSKYFDNFYYLNFDDERLIDFNVQDFDNLMTVFQKMHKAKTIFLDEVQNVENWERFARRIYEEGYKIFITGSNAKLLSSELTTHLTGRYFKINLYPFSFKEFLDYKKIDYKNKETQNKINILKNFDFYLANGGFPEFIKYNDNEFLKRIYEDILYKDLLVRFNIREVKAFKQLSNFLFANFTKELSYNSLKNILAFKSAVSVKNYIDFMQESFLVFELYKYDYSLKKQYISDKKIYTIDNGMRNTIAFSFFDDKGNLLENLVFLELKRRGQELYFFKDKQECDFIIKEKTKIQQAIQVTHILSKYNTEREIKGLIGAMDKFKLKNGLILTNNQEDIIKRDNFTITVMPVWKWLLN
ncbi:ATP-binding protein [Patescibacteria group bacterium]